MQSETFSSTEIKMAQDVQRSLFSYFVRIAIVFLIPLLASFLVYIVAVATGAGLTPLVGYGLQAATGGGGVTYLWCASFSCGTGDPMLPTDVFNIINALLILGSVVGGLILFIPMIHALTEERSERASAR
jgi:hypothetical protein